MKLWRPMAFSSSQSSSTSFRSPEVVAGLVVDGAQPAARELDYEDGVSAGEYARIFTFSAADMP